jgi:hypothetical protein
MGRFYTITGGTGTRRGLLACCAASGVRRLVAALALAVFSAPVHAQVQVQEDKWNRGYNGLAAGFRAAGLETVDRAQWRATPPERSLLVALGDFQSYPVDVESYVRRGGALLVATDRGLKGGTRLWGMRLDAGPVNALHKESWFQDFSDCPLVSSFEENHALTRGVLSVATNRPGAAYPLRRFAGDSWQTLAWLPELRSEPGDELRAGFLAARENASGGRAVVVADQSVFANQMLGYEDNPRFMINVVTWLSEGRTTLLMLDDRAIVSPPSLDDVQVEIPPPTPEEVRDVLRQLPPDVLVPFANAVLANVEDAGIPNDLLTFVVQSMAPRNYLRLLLFVATFCLALVAVRKLVLEPVAERAADESEAPGRTDRRRRARLERQQAARELLERFRADMAETSAIPWPVFASRLRLKDHRWQTWLLRRRLRKASARLAPESHRYWTSWRLRRLNAHVNAWRRLRTAGDLEYKT